MICVTKKTIQLAVAASALFASAGTALAADLPPPPPPYEIRSSVFDWGGVYIGGIVGVGSVESGYIPNGGADPDLNGSGFIGGGMLGYNYQMDNVVFGVEADSMFSNIDPFHHDQGGNQDEIKQDIDFLATLRARVGWAVDNSLFYGTAGVAFARSEIGISNSAVIPLPPGLKDKNWHTGFVVGGGVEHGFSPSLIGRLEYLYANFNQKMYNYSTGDNVKTGIDNMHLVRAGLAYKF